MNFTEEELARLHSYRAHLQTREEKLETALRFYATADFLTTEQQQVAQDALKRE